MNPFVILADVTCDLCKEVREYFGIEDYIKGHVHFSDGLDFQTELNWTPISRTDFYKALSNRKMQVSTAPASPEEYYEVFRKYAEKGYDILSMSISSKISSTFAVAESAAERIKKDFPERNIYCLDAYRMSGSFGLLVMYAYDLKAQGKSMQEIIEWLEESKHKVHQMGPIDDLMFIARRGRISTGKAVMGSFAGVKPMGDCNTEGYASVLTKVKGMKKALATTVAYIEKAAVNIEEQYILIAHSDREEYAMTLKEMIEAQLHPKKVFVSDVFFGSGTNIGPGMISVNFMGEPVSENSEKEKAIMDEVLGG